MHLPIIKVSPTAYYQRSRQCLTYVSGAGREGAVGYGGGYEGRGKGWGYR